MLKDTASSIHYPYRKLTISICMYVVVCALNYSIVFVKHLYSFKCCNQQSMNYNSAVCIPGCKKSKHCSEHHENYQYAAYATFIMDTVEYACEMYASRGLRFSSYMYISSKCTFSGLYHSVKFLCFCLFFSWGDNFCQWKNTVSQWEKWMKTWGFHIEIQSSLF